ncbi:folylpolyglutamate synthase/dihydrofolate synthase family protein [Fredinandcohnia sp. QZ13]|uniref:bifunctional folylpolyglutamate synthase/dihydrofolate synthase n=1 Tax=Fredinandcohnia sp. QZ13 TaxID=3073144 RepID=UPI002852F89B|nr:folylpolyglutamate synthase/dihydrofolate synthase family protein [Fredinandcohnia sp. QZ13]MDR4889123.1 folylpolyglutamate synthase/dihydrofolate synthase family protein [Fredinandcohnia sp. QZ13]
MIQTYDEALSWIHGRLRLGMKPGLSRMEWMMERLGHPQEKIKAIHVAGTNGKGSTVSYIRNMLQEAGYKIGTFTSPYIETFNERISVNGQPISDDEIVSLLQVIKPLAEELEETELGGPTEFEVITAMALYYFGEASNIDFVIMEVGLGGRLDSTNVIHPLISIITSIGFDHMNILGDTIEEIAGEKAGIIKQHVPVITAIEQPEAIEVINIKAKEKNSPFYQLGHDFFILGHQSNDGESFTVKTQNKTFQNLHISMKGAHQVRNASLAVLAVHMLQDSGVVQIEDRQLVAGLEKTKWIGRFEEISKNPLVILDGAHNPEGVNSLVDTVEAHLKGKDIHIIFSALSDKKLDTMIRQLERIAKSLTFTSFDYPRAATTGELFENSSAGESINTVDNWREAVEAGVERVSSVENAALIITGSLYFISEVRGYLLN